MKCPKCGAEMQLDRTVVYTSYPAQFKWTCPNCGESEYQECSQAIKESLETKPKKTVAEALIKPFDPWQNFRCNAAKDFLAASIQHSGFCGNPKDDNHISRAIQYADELIKQLEERDEHNNSK